MMNKRSFTLLEVCLALAILVLIASVTGVHIKRVIDTYRFETQVTDLFLSLQEAQVLSAAYQSDFALEIEKHKGQFFYRFSTDEPLSETVFSQKKVPLLPGTQVQFKNRPTTKLHLDIYSGGRVDPPGILTFQRASDPSLSIDMQHGHLLKFSHIKVAL